MKFPVSFQVRGLFDIQAFISTLPIGTRKTAVETATEFLIEDEKKGLRNMAPYKYVTRKVAYGETFSSDKQRRYVMAKIASGEITPGVSNRTGKISAGWTYKLTNNGYAARIFNDTEGSKYVYGDKDQANQPKLVGHKKMSKMINENLAGMMKRVNIDIDKWISEHSK
jgi:hypothetical protein